MSLPSTWSKWDKQAGESHDKPVGICGYCSGPVCFSTLYDSHYCQQCKIMHKSITEVNGFFYFGDSSYIDKALSCALCKTFIGEISVKLATSPHEHSDGFDYSDKAITQKMIAYLYRKHKDDCPVLQVLQLAPPPEVLHCCEMTP